MSESDATSEPSKQSPATEPVGPANAETPKEGLWSAQTLVEAQAFTADLERSVMGAVALARVEAQLFGMAAKRAFVWVPVLIFITMSLWAVLIAAIFYGTYQLTNSPWAGFGVVLLIHLAVIGAGLRILKYWSEQAHFKRFRAHLRTWGKPENG